MALLARAEMFEAATPPTLEALAGSLAAEHVAAHTVVVREGDEPDDMWIVASGTLDVTTGGAVVNHLGPGDYFGEIGLVRDIPRTATVTTNVECDLWRLPATSSSGSSTRAPRFRRACARGSSSGSRPTSIRGEGRSKPREAARRALRRRPPSTPRVDAAGASSRPAK